MKFKIWLENDENNDAIKKMEKYAIEGKFEKLKQLYEEALNANHLTKDQYRKLKDTFEDSTSDPYLEDFAKFSKEYDKREYEKNKLDPTNYAPHFILKSNLEHVFISDLRWASGSKRYSLLTKKSNQKYIESFPEEVQQACKGMLAYSMDYIEAKKKIDELKEKVKTPADFKAMKKSEDEERKKKELFMRPLASKMAMGKLSSQVEQVLESKQQEFIESYKNDLLNKFQINSEKVKNYKILNKDDMVKIMRQFMYFNILELFKFDYKNLTIEKVENTNEIVNKLSKNRWDAMSGFFKSRMINKIGPIVDKKAKDNNDFTMKTIEISIDGGKLVGRFNFDFTDQSSFNVKHQVVGYINKNNLGFYRFPTHFQNIKTADGTSYNFLSEEEMYKKFADIEKPKEMPEEKI